MRAMSEMLVVFKLIWMENIGDYIVFLAFAIPKGSATTSTGFKITCSTKRLATDHYNPESAQNLKVELVASIFEGTEIPLTFAIDVHDNLNRPLYVISVTRAWNITNLRYSGLVLRVSSLRHIHTTHIHNNTYTQQQKSIL